jgi:hypothetical protein
MLHASAIAAMDGLFTPRIVLRVMMVRFRLAEYDPRLGDSKLVTRKPDLADGALITFG